MTVIKLLFTCFLYLLSLATAAYDEFEFTPESTKSYIVKPKTKGGTVEIKDFSRDSDNNIFLLIQSQDTFPMVNGETLKASFKPKGYTVYTLTKVSNKEEIEWGLTFRTSSSNRLSIDDFQISPQGNIALGLTFQDEITSAFNSDSWIPVNRDILLLFFKTTDGSLIKEIHLSGANDEYSPQVQFGAGGEVFFTAKSNSTAITYGNDDYSFKLSKDYVKDLIVSLKTSLSTKWARSIEPANLVDLKSHNDNHLGLGLTYGKGFTLYRNSGSLKSYSKTSEEQNKVVVMALDEDGKVKWDTTITQASSLKNLQSFPNGNLGAYGSFSDKVIINNSETIQKANSKGTHSYFATFDSEGKTVSKAAISSTLSYSSDDKESNYSLFNFVSKSSDSQDKPVYYSSQSGDGLKTFTTSHGTESCQNHFIVDDNLNLAFLEVGGTCVDYSKSDSQLSDGKIKMLYLKTEDVLVNIEVPFGSEESDDELISGLAFKPQFYYGPTDDQIYPNSVLSYAIPEKADRAIIYYPKAGVTQKEFLSDPLVQVTLNSNYFRGIAVLVFTSNDSFTVKEVDHFISPLNEQSLFKTITQWHAVGYEDRASSIMEVHNKTLESDASLSIGKVKSVAFFYPEFDQTAVANDVGLAQIVEKLPTSFMISSDQDTTVRDNINIIQRKMVELGVDCSHIHFDGASVSRNTFSAINLYGEENSEVMYQSLVKNNCLDTHRFLNMNPQNGEFIDTCLGSDLPSSKQDETEDEAKEDLINFLSVYYGLPGHTPYVDQEYFEFIGYIDTNIVNGQVESEEKSEDSTSQAD